MNTEYLDEPLPEQIQAIVDEVERACGFSIALECGGSFGARGTLQHSPTSITLYFRHYPADLAVVAHEFCHARRHFVQQIPMLRLHPERELKFMSSTSAASEHLDNQLEHLVILQEMQSELGFPKDPTHIANDVQACERGIDDEFSRQCVLFLNWLLASLHFPAFQSRLRVLLEVENLVERADTLQAAIMAAGTSKPKIVAALVDALGIPREEVRLLIRDPKARLDKDASLDAVLDDEAGGSECPV